MRDLELLRQYFRDGSQEAFTKLVSRHVDAIYSAALRQVRSPDLASEVAQTVFLDLARRPRGLHSDAHLLSWLYLVARRRSVDIVRKEARRIRWERQAAESAALTGPNDRWPRIEALLDAAVASLSEGDRQAILLRFFEKKDFGELAQALRLSEDAAKKRVARSIDRMRQFLARRGVTTTAALIAAEIGPNAIQGAPPGLTRAISDAIMLAHPFARHAALYRSAHSLAMTLSQKVTVAAIAAAALFGGLYQNRLIRMQQRRLTALEQQLNITRAQIRQLTSERIRLTARLNAAQSYGDMEVTASENPTEKSLKSWLARVDQLKQRFEDHPDQKIPDLKFMTDEDWLNAARENLDTEKDYRRALAAMRNAAWGHSASYIVQPALRKYADANGGAYPTDISQLQPYLSDRNDLAILQEFEVVPQFAVNIHVGEKTVLAQRRQIDPENDAIFVVGTHGMGSAGPSPSNETSIVPLIDAFTEANNGALPTDPSQLLPYAITPDQQRGIQNAIVRSSARPR